MIMGVIHGCVSIQTGVPGHQVLGNSSIVDVRKDSTDLNARMVNLCVWFVILIKLHSR